MLVVAVVANTFACTNLIVGKNVSTDGSTIVSYSADSYGLFGELYHYPAGMHKKGTLIDVHEWDTGKYLGQIEQARQTYNVIGNMNEFRLLSVRRLSAGVRNWWILPVSLIMEALFISVCNVRAQPAKLSK